MELYKDAYKTQLRLFVLIQGIAKETGGWPYTKSNKKSGQIQLKKVYRTIEKSALRHKGNKYDYTQICDISRGTLTYNSIAGVLKGVKAILVHPDVEVIRFKNRFVDPPPSRWADCSFNLKFVTGDNYNDHIFEIQVAHQKMITTRRDLGGHKQYSRTRFARELTVYNGWLEG